MAPVQVSRYREKDRGRQMNNLLKSAVAATMMALTMSSTVQASGPAGAGRGLSTANTTMISLGRNTLAPFAFMKFCVKNPQDCQASHQASRIAWNSTARSLVGKVNRLVNRTMIPMNDVVETWNAGGASGDCEDNALTKRRALIKLGVPSSALRIATARTSSGAGHAVLVVSTDAGDMVLDNRFDRIKPWKKTDLQFIRIASAQNPMIWNAVY